MKRASGILAHITSIPNSYGIGSFGKEAKSFGDTLRECQCRYWQVLPFNPIDICNSPYRSDSAFAGNVLLIDLENLRDRGLITDEELDSCRTPDGWRVDFEKVKEDRKYVFRQAFSRITDPLIDLVENFSKENEWLEDYALYKALEEEFEKNWIDWPVEYRDRDPKALASAKELFEKEILYHKFLQYIFFDQWNDTKEYVNSRGVEVIGDIPMYVDFNSVDVWAHKDLFKLENDKPSVVAGVPPDFFSETGQLWGNPIYNWKAMKKDNYKWWIDRIKHCLNLYDMLRIDHFRAFAVYFEIDADAKSAINGKWVEGPGIDFFKVLDKEIKDPRLIAEDLGGDTDPEVQALLKKTGIPGMRVTEMAFISMGESVHLPFNYVNNSVCYLGTHDNNTLLGWLKDDLTDGQREYALQYFNFNKPDDDWISGGPNSEVTHAFMRGLFETAAGVTIIQLQDALGLGGDCRMNMPGKAEGNWTFKVPQYYLDTLNTGWIKFFNMTYQRYLNDIYEIADNGND